MSEYNHIVDLPHWDEEGNLTTALTIDTAEDGSGVFVTVTGKPRESSGGNARTTTKLNHKEMSYMFTQLLRYILTSNF